MSQTLIMLLVVGTIIGAVVFRCKAEFLAPLCEMWPEGESLDLDEVIGAHNRRPTIADNPKTNDYRSTLLTKGNPKVTSKAIRDQSDFSNPKTAAKVKTYLDTTRNNTARSPNDKVGAKSGNLNCSSAWCKTYPHMCPKCPKSNYASATSLFSTTRLSI